MRQTSIHRIIGNIANQALDPGQRLALMIIVGGHRAVAGLEFEACDRAA
jgi:hypothetical protein